MSQIRRYYIPETLVFITVVTKDRRPMILMDEYLAVFWLTVKRVREMHPFEIFAHVILPDHFHWLIQPTMKDGNFSTIMHSFKRNYTINLKKALGINKPARFWQTGFWDHKIRSEKDFVNHINYIHWNPVHHGFVNKPEDWSHSSYLDFHPS
jgi:putative transposase